MPPPPKDHEYGAHKTQQSTTTPTGAASASSNRSKPRAAASSRPAAQNSKRAAAHASQLQEQQRNSGTPDSVYPHRPVTKGEASCDAKRTSPDMRDSIGSPSFKKVPKVAAESKAKPKQRDAGRSASVRGKGMVPATGETRSTRDEVHHGREYHSVEDEDPAPKSDATRGFKSERGLTRKALTRQGGTGGQSLGRIKAPGAIPAVAGHVSPPPSNMVPSPTVPHTATLPLADAILIGHI